MGRWTSTGVRQDRGEWNVPIGLGIFPRPKIKIGLLPNFAVFCGSGFYMLLAFFSGNMPVFIYGHWDGIPRPSEKLSYEEMVNQIKKNTRRYAKRQMTWFRKDKRIHWIDVEGKNTDQLLSEIETILKVEQI